jgi:hypothetical protein
VGGILGWLVAGYVFICCFLFGKYYQMRQVLMDWLILSIHSSIFSSYSIATRVEPLESFQKCESRDIYIYIKEDQNIKDLEYSCFEAIL